MYIEQAKEVHVVGNSNVHKFSLVNVLHVAHEEDKDDNPCHIMEATSKLLKIQG